MKGTMKRIGSVRSKQNDIERKIDDLERRLREKIDVSIGYGDKEACIRKLEAMFKFFDKNNSGYIDINEFIAALTKLNFIGVQAEVEGLFNRFDEDASGTIDYKEFANYLYGAGTIPLLDRDSRDIVERFKARLIEMGGANGVHSLSRIIKRMDFDGSGTIDRGELEDGLYRFGIDNVTPKELQRLFNYFDRDRSGRINIDEFMRGIKTGMSYERKQIVRDAFRRLDTQGHGIISVEDILRAYDTSTHPSVAGGTITPSQAAEELMAVFTNGNKQGYVTWPDFLDYYKGISLAVEDDNYFELMVRNAWHLNDDASQMGGSTTSTARRVLIVHNDGRQEVIEVVDNLGAKKFDTELIMKRLRARGITDIAEIHF